MVDEIRDIQHRADQLNLLLDGVTPYRLGVLPPDAFVAAPLNAHHMRKTVYDQLVANIKADGNLSTLPFCWHHEGTAYTLSGHHRIEAARDAGVDYLLYLYTDDALDEERRLAIQLSHNALVGEDDLSILQQRWRSSAAYKPSSIAALTMSTSKSSNRSACKRSPSAISPIRRSTPLRARRNCEADRGPDEDRADRACGARRVGRAIPRRG